MHGFIASGKTTKAKELEKEHCAVRFTSDEWMCSLNGEYSPKSDFNNILKIAEKQNVILDYGFWTKKSRDEIEIVLKSHKLQYK